MTAPVPITRADCTSAELHDLASECKSVSVPQARRLRAIALVLDGWPRSQVGRALGTTAQSVRDWVVRYNSRGPEGLVDALRPGRPGRLTAAQRAAVAVGHICDRANADEMNRHLADIAAAVPPGRHAVLVLDGAGWHRSKRLEVPANISLLRLPPYGPELNPMENVFAFLKGNFLANPVFATVEEVRNGIASAWTNFLSDPERIASITTPE